MREREREKKDVSKSTKEHTETLEQKRQFSHKKERLTKKNTKRIFDEIPSQAR